MFTYRDVLDSDGLIARLRPGYERRPAQLAMAAGNCLMKKGKNF